ncbi:NADP-dependent oxidoreductase [Winogradskya consettensis]|uniref:Oxidoreductase n=1 Tax=Winogradskya consettensis TaxID=113560 RepID=A0A919VLH0_9ACTN|nr:NADP-dependent oxidoreductase [Actinoplanes consettensis]GIM70599.1 oxidoreductase [Actinoplanes consettensis]
MRAVQFVEYGPPGVVHVAEVSEPHAGPGTIRIAVRASGFSAGETLIRSGRMRDTMPVQFPFRSGFDAAGVVDEVGPGVSGVEPGDEVFGWTTARGANADFTVLQAWAPKPPGWSWAQAGGAAGSVETGVRVLDLLAVEAGQTVLVQGAAGGVGTVTVQLAVARGARVIGTASAANHDLLRSLGAEPVLYGPGLPDRVQALGGADAVVDCAGGSLPDLIAIAGDPAKVVTIADLGAAGHGVHLSHGGVDALAVHSLGIAVDLAAQGRLQLIVAARFPLEQAAAAHELSETRHARGKIVLIT